MKFSPKFSKATFIKRYKRFLTDIQLADGSVITVHCPNTGSMKNCVAPGTPCWYSTSDNPKRKYPNTLELITTPTGDLAGINTSRTNALVAEAIANGVVAELAGYRTIKPEVKCAIDNSRIDFLLSDGRASEPDCFVEVKNVTLREADGLGYFPDAVSERGSKHLRALMALKAEGYRSVLFFCVQHSGITSVSPADHIDAVYGQTLREAAAAGVEILAYGCQLSASCCAIDHKLPVRLNNG
ncbi:DNA/RNA nuclease SfsA [Halioxenophilus sp. WMMB6]|uniref:DNA/RNA nuclease SfsA n=1 Tax=Halioxenophilus sp. WMMB6 TaxID=3073815 RepID=UPI00295E6843|nr:DNA/RNA nuclease SfsA [Halioxenophilus sp. WMMB6]